LAHSETEMEQVSHVINFKLRTLVDAAAVLFSLSDESLVDA